MFYIHGGAYQEGFSTGHPGYFLAEQGVVAVSITYRLGVLGNSTQTIDNIIFFHNIPSLFGRDILSSGYMLKYYRKVTYIPFLQEKGLH